MNTGFTLQYVKTPAAVRRHVCTSLASSIVGLQNKNYILVPRLFKFKFKYLFIFIILCRTNFFKKIEIYNQNLMYSYDSLSAILYRKVYLFFIACNVVTQLFWQKCVLTLHCVQCCNKYLLTFHYLQSCSKYVLTLHCLQSCNRSVHILLPAILQQMHPNSLLLAIL